MIVAKIQVSGATANTVHRKVIPAGVIGAQVELEYSEDIWQGLHKTVVFKGAVTKDVITDAEVVTIPAEAVAKHGYPLRVGVYGVDAYNNLAIPTIWADLGTVRDAADPSGDTTADPTLPVWAQLQTMIGNLDELETTARDNLVAAINEALTKGGGEVDPEAVQKIVEDYIAANPPTITETDPTVPAWAKQPEKPSYTADEVGALSAETLPSAINTAMAQAKASGEFDGADGKSAYQYAQDGGYTGTEAEFAAKLAEQMPDRLPNPNALTFSGSVTGSYDGSAPLSVEIPQGGGGLSDYELIDTLDWSTEELAQFYAGKEYSFEEIRDICLVYTGVANNTTTVSGLNVVVNNIALASSAEPVSGKSGTPQNGYVFLHSIPGIGLFSLKSPGATASNNYIATNANIAYNLHPVTEKITKFKISNRVMGYCTNMGILKIYVR